MRPEDSLFDLYERSDPKPRAQMETKFSFWNRSGWSSASEVRSLLDRIYSLYPPEHRLHIRNRLRSNRDGDFDGALLELLLFAMLDPSTVHVSAGTPDFEFERLGHTYALEVKAFDESGSGNRREGQLLDRIEARLQSHDYFLSIMPRGELRRMPPDSAYIRPLADLLETPRTESDLDMNASIEINLDRYSDHSYRLDVRLWPKSTHSSTHPLIGALTAPGPWVGAAEIEWGAKLRRGIERKANLLTAQDCYIAVSVPADPTCPTENIAIRALYGFSDATLETGNDCFWRKGARSRNTHVRGVAVFGALLPQALDHPEMVGQLYMAPRASEPPGPLARLPRIGLADNVLFRRSGARLGTLVLDGLRANGRK